MKNFFIQSLLIWIGCGLVHAQNTHNNKPHQTKQEIAEAKALSCINALYEVKDFMRYAKASQPVVLLDGDPDTTWNYYQVKVGISNFNMMRTSYHFFVAPKTYKVYIWDEMDDSGEVPMHLISLQRWRHWRRDPRFDRFHTFKNNKLVVLDSKGNVVNEKKDSRTF